MSDPLMPTIEVTREDNEVKVKTIEPTSGSEVIKATPLTSFLQIENPTPKEQDQLKEVWEYVLEDSKSELRSEQLYTLRQMEQRLAAPRLGQTRVDQLHQFVEVSRQVRSAEKLRNSFLR